MPVPKEILEVERPVNTVVIMYGKNKDKYGVRKRIGCKRVGGRNVPVNGPTIGHIINGTYIPLEEKDSISKNTPALKDWANIQLADRLFQPLLNQLAMHYSYEDRIKIYCISLLRVCYPGIKDYELKEHYENSFLSELYPGTALSRNIVSKFLCDLGKSCNLIAAFMQDRMKGIAESSHVIIDGTLKSDDSKINSLSDFSRKAKIRGAREISVLYAYDLENQEPICSKCYPGNMLDITAFPDFIESNGLQKGIIVGDKAFPSNAIEKILKNHPGLHYLNPIKRNAKIIEKYDMYTFSDILKGYEGITCRKTKRNSCDKWLYSFRNVSQAAQEEQVWLQHAEQERPLDDQKYQYKLKTFGTVVFESDMDLEPEVIYKTYASRWEIEIVMRYYKSALDFDETRVHNDYSVIGSEFCDFLSTILTFRLIKEFDKNELLKKYTYKKLINILCRAKKIQYSQENGWNLIQINPSYKEVLEKLSLLPPEPTPAPKKPGRPKKTTI